MGDLVTIVVVLGGVSIFTGLAAWLVRAGYGQLGGLAHGKDDAAWWRSSLPWPDGVQEDDEIAWHVPRPLATPDGGTIRQLSSGRPVPPTRPQPRIKG